MTQFYKCTRAFFPAAGWICGPSFAEANKKEGQVGGRRKKEFSSHIFLP